MDVYDPTSYEQQVTCRTKKKTKKIVPKILSCSSQKKTW